MRADLAVLLYRRVPLCPPVHHCRAAEALHHVRQPQQVEAGPRQGLSGDREGWGQLLEGLESSLRVGPVRAAGCTTGAGGLQQPQSGHGLLWGGRGGGGGGGALGDDGGEELAVRAPVPVHEERHVASLPLADGDATGETNDLCPFTCVVKAHAGQLVRRDDVTEGPGGEGVEPGRGVGVLGALGVLLGPEAGQLVPEGLQDEGAGGADHVVPEEGLWCPWLRPVAELQPAAVA